MLPCWVFFRRVCDVMWCGEGDGIVDLDLDLDLGI